jgi:putative Holliday junction resolvase
MKYLAVDYGQKRTGLAVSDAGGSMAFPLRVVPMHGRERFVSELPEIARAEKAEALVVGLPRHGDGEHSETTRQVLNMVRTLQAQTDLPIYLVEEYLSSWDAEARLREAGRSGKKALARLDAAAAAAILESFLSLSAPQRESLRFAEKGADDEHDSPPSPAGE